MELPQSENIKEFTYDVGTTIPLEGIPVIAKDQYTVEEKPLTGDAFKGFVHVFPDNAYYIAKTGSKSYPNESITEYLLGKLGEIFGLQMAEGKLAFINNQLRFMSKYFINSATQTMVHGKELLSRLYNDEQKVMQIEAENLAREQFTLQVVEESIRQFAPTNYQVIIHDLVKLLLYDALVGNNDRHYENWAILIDNQGNEPPKLSPIYDTARGLLWNITESRLHRFSQRSASFKKYAKQCYPKMGWKGVPGKEIDHFKLVKMIYENEFYITKTEIKKLFDDSVIVKMKDCVKTQFSKLMTELRINLICDCLKYRHEQIIQQL